LASVLVGIDDRAIGGPLVRLLESRGHQVAWVGALDVTPGRGARMPDAVIVDGDAPGMELSVVAAAWRNIDPRPELIVVSGQPEVLDLAIRVGAHVVAAPATPEALAAVVAGLETRAQDAEAAARFAAARDLDIVDIREALRPRMNHYVTATPLARRLAVRGVLVDDEARFALGLDGTRTVRRTIDSRGLAPPTAARILYALVHADAAVLSPEPPSTTPRAAAVAAARRHLRARWNRVRTADYYSVLEIPHGATAGDVDHAARSLALRFAPDSGALYDLGDAAQLVQPLWDQILAARTTLRDPRLRQEYDVALAAAQPGHIPPDAAGAEELFQRGQRSLAAGQVTQAATELAAAARRFPDEPDYETYAAWARVLVEEERGVPRREAAQKQRSLAEETLWGRRPRPRALYVLALLAEAVGDRDAARAHLREALAVDPQLGPAHKLFQRLTG
jgi:DNA-binding response OmpR family regulator